MRQPLPIGIEDYKEIIDIGYYYADKTLLIKELLEKRGKANLFTRPRRFGKTLTLSMLRTFFERELDDAGQPVDNSHYFAGKKIMETGESYTAHLGKYPVIFLSLKSAKQPAFEIAYKCLISEIAREYERHDYILEGERLTPERRERFLLLRDRKAEDSDYATALAFLSQCLDEYHQKKVIILIDEYDVPLENSYFRGFYPQMVDFIRSLFESALKTNNNLAFAVITGCLRISKESIFTGLNNLKIVSILSDNYAEYFGFTPEEVEEMLDTYGLEARKEEARHWYDGYLFGETEVYNPWSVINYVDDLTTGGTEYPKPYWSNTSSNSIVREMVELAKAQQKAEIERLIEGGSIEKQVHEDITYEDIHKTQDNLWNFLFFTGYLKAVSTRYEGENIYLTLKIPNAEIRYIYRNTIQDWFEQSLKTMDRSRLFEAVKNGNAEAFGLEVTKQLQETISFFDYAENYYHGFLAGLLQGCPGFVIQSNRESGEGRPDLIMRTVSLRGVAIILEIKTAKNIDDMEALCNTALLQIEEKNYQAQLYQDGYRCFLKYGVCFYRKECLIKRSGS